MSLQERRILSGNDLTTQSWLLEVVDTWVQGAIKCVLQRFSFLPLSLFSIKSRNPQEKNHINIRVELR